MLLGNILGISDRSLARLTWFAEGCADSRVASLTHARHRCKEALRHRVDGFTLSVLSRTVAVPETRRSRYL